MANESKFSRTRRLVRRVLLPTADPERRSRMRNAAATASSFDGAAVGKALLFSVLPVLTLVDFVLYPDALASACLATALGNVVATWHLLRSREGNRDHNGCVWWLVLLPLAGIAVLTFPISFLTARDLHEQSWPEVPLPLMVVGVMFLRPAAIAYVVAVYLRARKFRREYEQATPEEREKLRSPQDRAGYAGSSLFLATFIGVPLTAAAGSVLAGWSGVLGGLLASQIVFNTWLEVLATRTPARPPADEAANES